MNGMLGCFAGFLLLCIVIACIAMALKIILFILWAVGATLYFMAWVGGIAIPVLIGLFILYKLGKAAFR